MNAGTIHQQLTLHPSSALEAAQRHPSAAPIPVVVDANVLIRDVCANLRRAKTTALLGLLLEGRIRVLVTDRVAYEVATRMGRVAGQDLDRALALWYARYVPLLRVVMVAEVDAEPELSALLDGVRERDPDDVPTAYLSLLCAPCAVVTEDHDLLDHGFGAPEWVSALRASGALGDLDSGLFYGADLTGSLVEGVAVGAFRLGRLTARSPIAIGLVLGIVVFAASDGRPAIAAQLERVRPALGRALEVIGHLLQKLVEQRTALLETFGPCTLAPLEDPPLVARLAAQLVTAVEPLGAAELARREGRREQDVRAVLRGHPAFEVVRGRGWQLGRSGTSSVALSGEAPALPPA